MSNNERVVGGIKTRVLHNKDYVEVAERIRIAHAVEDDFEMVEDHVVEIGGRFLWRAVIRVKGKIYMGHAEVKLDAPKNTPDGTNPYECAETSAIGRALAFAGLGTIESIASYDEIARSLPVVSVQPAQARTVESAPARQQIAAPSRTEPIDEAPATEPQMASIHKLYRALGLQVPARSLTYAQAKGVIEKASKAYREKQAARAQASGDDGDESVDAISGELLAKKQSA